MPSQSQGSYQGLNTLYIYIQNSEKESERYFQSERKRFMERKKKKAWGCRTEMFLLAIIHVDPKGVCVERDSREYGKHWKRSHPPPVRPMADQ